MPPRRRLRFPFENSEGEIESLWTLERDDRYEIDNIPFYVKDLALGDVVSAKTDNQAHLWFSALLAPGGHSTIQLWLAREEDIAEIRDQLRAAGCESEIADLRRLVAVDIPPAVDYCGIKRLLDQKEAEGVLEYQEACIGHREP